MAGHHARLRCGEVAVDHVQVGAAHRAGVDAHEHLVVAGRRHGQLAGDERPPGAVEAHRPHDTNLTAPSDAAMGGEQFDDGGVGHRLEVDVVLADGDEHRRPLVEDRRVELGRPVEVRRPDRRGEHQAPRAAGAQHRRGDPRRGAGGDPVVDDHHGGTVHAERRSPAAELPGGVGQLGATALDRPVRAGGR